ncbi:MAG: cobalamin-binding protein [Acidobacteria bacterium]|nr:cobalamin-binding protein [Acidobacteriota bacterium]
MQVRSFEFKWLVALALVFVAIAGSSCRPSGTDNSSSPDTRIFKDALGRDVTLPRDVKRVVSLAPNLTEIIYAVGGGDKLVGDTTYCDFPEAAKSVQKIGDTMNPNMEAIIALHPDVVFVSTASQIEAFMRTLAERNIAVYVVDARSVKDVLIGMITIGDILGTKGEAQSAVAGLERRIEIVRSSVNGRPIRRVFVQISKEPLFTAGHDAYMNEAVRIAGGDSVTSGIPGAYPNLSRETALKLDPDAIVISDNEGNHEPNSAFANSAAVKNGEVFRINADLLSRPGPRVVDAIELIAHDLHPEAFESK